MAYAFFYDVPGDEHLYEKVKAHIGNEQPDGLLVQLVVKSEAGGLRHFQVWESEQQWLRFRDEQVQPAVQTVLAGIGIPEAPPPPSVEVMEMVDLIIAG